MASHLSANQNGTLKMPQGYKIKTLRRDDPNVGFK